LSSHLGDADPSTSPARQEAVCRAWCESKGWTVADVVSDLDVSGSDKGLRLNRPGLDKIRAQWGAVDVVIFAKLDRLARNVIDFRAFAEEADAHGAALVSVAESLDLTSPGGRFVATILAAFAEMEAATIAERTMGGMTAARELGRYTGGPLPYGYRAAVHPSGAGKILVPYPPEAEIVREAARRVLSGETTYAISKDFNDRHAPLPASATTGEARGKAWRQTGLRRLLTSAAVVGRVMHGQDFVRDESGEPRQFWEPLLSLDEWHRLRAKFAPQDDRPARKRADWPLSGMVRCDLCGGPCSAGQGQHGTRRYRCLATAGAGKCPGVTINAETLEAYTEAEMLRVAGSLPVTETIEVETDDGRRADITASLATLARQITEPGADVAGIASRISAFSAERDALPATAAREVHTVATGRTLAEEYAAAEDIARRRKLMSGVILGVYVRRATHRGRQGFDETRANIVWTPEAVALMIVDDMEKRGGWVKDQPLYKLDATADAT
jgi:site-specific DNA recombinase